MKFSVTVKRRVLKGIKKMPTREQERLAFLIKALAEDGPAQPSWPNYSKLSITEYHCHLSRKWVTCWRHDEGTIEIEVYYAGSRENSPY